MTYFIFVDNVFMKSTELINNPTKLFYSCRNIQKSIICCINCVAGSVDFVAAVIPYSTSTLFTTLVGLLFTN